MNDALDERVLEASVVAALDRIKSSQEKFPDQRVAIERELSLIEARARRLLDLMGDGKGNALMMKELDALSERKEALAQELKSLDVFVLISDLDTKRLARDLRSRLGDIPALFSHGTYL